MRLCTLVLHLLLSLLFGLLCALLLLSANNWLREEPTPAVQRTTCNVGAVRVQAYTCCALQRSAVEDGQCNSCDASLDSECSVALSSHTPVTRCCLGPTCCTTHCDTCRRAIVTSTPYDCDCYAGKRHRCLSVCLRNTTRYEDEPCNCACTQQVANGLGSVQCGTCSALAVNVSTSAPARSDPYSGSSAQSHMLSRVVSANCTAPVDSVGAADVDARQSACIAAFRAAWAEGSSVPCWYNTREPSQSQLLLAYAEEPADFSAHVRSIYGYIFGALALLHAYIFLYRLCNLRHSDDFWQRELGMRTSRRSNPSPSRSASSVSEQPLLVLHQQNTGILALRHQPVRSSMKGGRGVEQPWKQQQRAAQTQAASDDDSALGGVVPQESESVHSPLLVS